MLAKTREGRPVHGIQLGGGTAEEPAPLGVWVQARQHAWEAGASWVSRGFVEWSASADPAAVELRRLATVYVIPIMDVDNVTLGAGGKEAVPRDHNRDWDDQPVYPEVAAAQQRIRDLDAQGRLHVFIDLHNPGPGEPRPYFYGPLDLDQMPVPQQRNHARLLALAAECIRDPLPLDAKYHFATYVKTDEERRRVSTAWVRNHTGENVVAVCLETAWDTPHSTAHGYQAVGRQLAKPWPGTWPKPRSRASPLTSRPLQPSVGGEDQVHQFLGVRVLISLSRTAATGRERKPGGMSTRGDSLPARISLGDSLTGSMAGVLAASGRVTASVSKKPVTLDPRLGDPADVTARFAEGIFLPRRVATSGGSAWMGATASQTGGAATGTGETAASPSPPGAGGGTAGVDSPTARGASSGVMSDASGSDAAWAS